MDFDKLAIKLSYGAHDKPQNGMCIMECVAYIAGEAHTDEPKCADPYLGRLAVLLNDRADFFGVPEKRQSLLPLVLRLAGSRTTNSTLLKHRKELTVLAMSCISEATVRLHEAERFPLRKPMPMPLSKMGSILSPSEPPIFYYDIASRIEEAKANLHSAWERGFKILNLLLPTLEDAYCGFAPEVVEKKLHELEEITS